MGRAQVVQAEAAGILPDVRMNPILLKPTTDMGSQVIVDGTVRGTMKAAEYYRRKPEFLPAVLEAYRSLAEEYDIIVIEGAGSPAEINLKKDDFVNMGLARLVDAPVLLVGDIDRGGVFAQLYGTVALLEADERSRVKGVVVNKGTGRSWSRDWPSWKSCAACRWRGCCPISTWTSTMRTAFLAASAGIRRQSWWTSPSFACPGSPISRTWDLLSATKMCRCGMWPPYGSWVRRTASFCREPRVPLETFCGCGRAVWRLR
jgi:hypothetical protein